MSRALEVIQMETTARRVVTAVRRFKPKRDTEFEQWDQSKVYALLEFGKSNEDGNRCGYG